MKRTLRHRHIFSKSRDMLCVTRLDDGGIAASVLIETKEGHVHNNNLCCTIRLIWETLQQKYDRQRQHAMDFEPCRHNKSSSSYLFGGCLFCFFLHEADSKFIFVSLIFV